MRQNVVTVNDKMSQTATKKFCYHPLSMVEGLMTMTMTMTMTRTLVVAVGLLVCACASSGHKVTEDQLSQLKVGQTTWVDMIQTLGQPTTSGFSSTGARFAVYAYSQVTARPESFIPIVGPLVGGADTKSNAVTLFFDPNGKLSTFTGSATAIGAGQGLEAGVIPQRVEVQH